jgi:S-DNA-T family DNA segregation ATPase FtsK/SpoIIIE
LVLSEQWVRQVPGIALAALGLFGFFGILAYFFTWQGDYAQVSGGSRWMYLVEGPTADHWLGRSGALVSHLLVNRGFGPAALFIPWILLLMGIRLMFIDSTLQLGRRIYSSLVLMLSLSCTLSYLGNDLAQDGFAWGGRAGNAMSSWLIGFGGTLGTAFILGLFWFVYFSILMGWVFSVAALQSRLPWLFSRPLNTSALDDGMDDGLDDGLDSGASAGDGAWRGGVQVEGGGRTNARSGSGAVAGAGGMNAGGLYPDDLNAGGMSGGLNSAVDPNGGIQNDEQAAYTDFDREDGPDADEHPVAHNFGGTTGEPELEIRESADEGLEHVKAGGVALSSDQLYDPKLDLSGYKYPPIDLLEEYGSQKIQIHPDELERNKNQITETLRHYNIGIDKIRATVGPTVTLYEIVPAAGVRISRIKNLEDDIALSLAALGIRIIAPMPGKGTIGIEVPNQNKEMVGMRSLLASEKFIKTDMELPMALGKTISNEIFIADLAKMPHLLMAGATGQGKSVGLNAMLLSLLYKKHPSELKLVLVDPKKVELSLFRHIERHFLARLPDNDEAIVTDTLQVVDTMQSLCIEMDRRYDLLKDAQVRNLSEYNDKFRKRKLLPRDGHRFLPYIVVVIDEFADLIMTAGKEIEMPIARLAQLARAVGIHLIIATQRPSVNIITGTIKANFPARIAFKVSSRIDSRTILDAGGADQLIGRGDMLLSQGSDVIRLQCAFVDTPEVESVCNYIGGQRGYPDAFLLPEYSSREEGSSVQDFDPSERDPMFDEAARVIVHNQIGSTSLLQRKMKLGYNRAGRIIDQLEAAGIVGPFEGSKPREVLVGDEYSLEQLLKRLDK